MGSDDVESPITVVAASFDFRISVDQLNQLQIGEYIYSASCMIRNLPWKIRAKKEMLSNVPYFGFFVFCEGVSESSSWECFAKLKLSVLSHKNTVKDSVARTEQLYCSKSGGRGRGYRRFMSWSKLMDPNSSYIENDAITLRAKIVAGSPIIGPSASPELKNESQVTNNEPPAKVESVVDPISSDNVGSELIEENVLQKSEIKNGEISAKTDTNKNDILTDLTSKIGKIMQDFDNDKIPAKAENVADPPSNVNLCPEPKKDHQDLMKTVLQNDTKDEIPIKTEIVSDLSDVDVDSKRENLSLDATNDDNSTKMVKNDSTDNAGPEITIVAATLDVRIDNLSQLKTEANVLSKPLIVHNLPWRIFVLKRKNKPDALSLAFYVACDGKPKCSSWECFAKLKFSILSQKKYVKDLCRETEHLFCSKVDDWGYRQFLAWSIIMDPERGFIKDDAIILRAEIIADPPTGLKANSKFKNVSQDVTNDEIPTKTGIVAKPPANLNVDLELKKESKEVTNNEIPAKAEIVTDFSSNLNVGLELKNVSQDVTNDEIPVKAEIVAEPRSNLHVDLELKKESQDVTTDEIQAKAEIVTDFSSNLNVGLELKNESQDVTNDEISEEVEVTSDFSDDDSVDSEWENVSFDAITIDDNQAKLDKDSSASTNENSEKIIKSSETELSQSKTDLFIESPNSSTKTTELDTLRNTVTALESKIDNLEKLLQSKVKEFDEKFKTFEKERR